MKVLKFYSKTCGPCKVMSNHLKKLTGVEIQEVDVAKEENEALLDKYKVRAVPTIVVVDDSGNTLAEFRGITPIEEILKVINGRQTATA